jgi:hypothetical protein
MLLRFGVENHRSIRHYTELSFVSTSQHDAPLWRMASPEAPHGVLPVLGVYGANASGKSNLLNAAVLLRDHVARSFTDLAPDGEVPWTPWHNSDAPTRLDVDVDVDGVRHHYGFRFDRSGFREEWLYAFPRGRRQVLYHRDHSQAEPWYFGPALGGQRAEIRKATRPNALFLSAAAQFAHADLTPVWQALASVRTDAPVELRGTPAFPPDAPLLVEANREVVLRLLRAADIGVVDLHGKANESRFAAVRELLVGLLGPEKGALEAKPLADYIEVWLTHEAANGERWEHEPELESRGTHILLSRVNDILAHLSTARLMVVDEIDTSLHPELCGALVDLFTDQRANPKGAQLLFSTHDRGLLSRLRRDEVVLLDKADDGGTVARTAADFKGLRARDDLARVYAEGRIGGVPVLSDWRPAVETWHGR